jgi:uncharacterized protein YqeY
MITLKELQTGKIKLRLTDPARSTTYGEILNDIKIRAKVEGNREPSEADIQPAFVRMNKTLSEAVKQVEGKLQEEYQAQLEVVQEFLPQMATEEEVTKKVDGIIAAHPGITVKQMGLVMKELKETFGATLDGRMASTIVKSKF